MAWILSADHFNFKGYIIEREVVLEILIFNLKLYKNGKQNIQF